MGVGETFGRGEPLGSSQFIGEVGRRAIQWDEQDNPELSWQERSLCSQTDPDAFFPEKGGRARDAKKVCVGCEVRAECLEYALDNGEDFGVWGGLSERERRKLKKRAT